MKFCQVENKKLLLYISIFVIFLFSNSRVVFAVESVGGQSTDSLIDQKSKELEEMDQQYLDCETSQTEIHVAGGCAALKAARESLSAQLGKLEDLKANENKNFLQKFSWDKLLEQLKTAGSKALVKSISEAMNKIAFDTATWIGSGGKGQKPLFITEGWGTYLSNVADEAAGSFLESIGNNGYVNFNLCSPNPAVIMKINLGLYQYARPQAPSCTFSQLTKNWEKSLSDKDFLPKFQDMFNPASNDLGIALSLQTGMMQNIKVNTEKAGLYRQEGGGWLDIQQFVGTSKYDPKRTSPPGYVQERLRQTMTNQTMSLHDYTGDALVDAANVFLNQLGITLFNNLMSKLGAGADDYTSPYSGNFGGLADINAGPDNGGIAGAKEQFRKLIEPKFDERGDYDILAELTMCPDPNKAGPTNCVITDKFRQAIAEKKTVGEALKLGYLNAGGTFGFQATDKEPGYNNENYPYRSMAILRKFRIIPVGWEVAAQYINKNTTIINNHNNNLKDMVACFDPEDDYKGYGDTGTTDEDWCRGLVDPNWVLKAPKNYCKREGPGPEIMSDQITGEGYDSKRSILRNDKYCADEQSCINENEDGSCNTYGYCTEERRTWNFGSPSCTPLYNTCQTFKGRDGRTVSYLENTLDTSCDANSVGCAKYTASSTYDKASSTVRWKDDSAYYHYFNKNAEKCADDGEGCHEFIRTKAGQGANLLKNSSFERRGEDPFKNFSENMSGVGDGTADNFDEWGLIGYATTTSNDGKIGVILNGQLNKTADVSAAGAQIDGEVFALSFYAQGCSNSSFSFMVAGSPADSISIATGTESWSRYETKHIYGAYSGNQVTFRITPGAGQCIIDAVKLERIGADSPINGGSATAYSDYANAGKIYEKLVPNYLYNYCYDAEGKDKIDAPAACSKFVRTCHASEAGCELYSRTSDDMKIPAKVTADNYCPTECTGYDQYMQLETAFESQSAQYFIPGKEKACSAEAAGCDEFTNLDKVSQGGEAREYYTSLRQCVKPDSPEGSSCAEFYTWEGSDESGFQLKVFQLKASSSDLSKPAASDGSDECDYGLKPGEVGYELNKDCREFYAKNGTISHFIYSKTISCSDNCHPYRRTENNVNPNITSSSNCATAGGHWDAAANQCVVCKDGGTWDDQHGACLYNAVPGEGSSCSAEQAGCREYTGNTGNSTKIILTSGFEGSKEGWIGESGTAVDLDNTSLKAGGHSIKVSGSGTRKASILLTYPQVNKGKSYVLSFFAKAIGTPPTITPKLVNGAAGSTAFGQAVLSADWKFYTVNISALDYDPDAQEKLVLEAGGDFYIDDIKLVEISDRYYLIKGNPWNVPDSCDQDIYGTEHPHYMAGCAEYTDRDSKTLHLHNFASFCQESAVGCELVIDTNNSDDYKGRTITAETPNVTISGDSFTHVVYNKGKECNQADKGCQLFGKANGSAYNDAYVKNDPDKYDQILCSSNKVGCEEWARGDNKGLSYFRDPGDNVCEWKQKSTSTQEGWYLKNTNTPCLISQTKTIGLGGDSVNQPLNQAGLCPASESSCTEVVDPVSKFNNNLLFNPDCSPSGGCGGWEGGVSQTVNVEHNALYILKGEGQVSVSCNSDIHKLTGSVLTAAGTGTMTNSSGESIRVYMGNNNKCTITRSPISGKVEFKKAVVAYKLAGDLKIDNKDADSCHGTFNYDDGCILFNIRGSQAGSGSNSLVFDADATYGLNKPTAPSICTTGSDACDSNTIIKVRPDRVCDKWLACRSSVQLEGSKEKACFDIGLCNGFGGSGDECGSWADTTESVASASLSPSNNFSSNGYGNVSGYSRVGLEGETDVNMSALYNLGDMEQGGESAEVPNGSFEFYGANRYPIGWTLPSSSGSWDSNKFKVIDNPVEAKEVEKMPHYNAPDGSAFLSLGSSFKARSEPIDVEKNINYILTAYINTINLKSEGDAKVKIFATGSKTNLLEEVSLNYANDWTKKLAEFNTGGNSQITIFLENNGTAAASTTGNSYFDDIKLKPALETKNDWYDPQICRLYPQTDSLSCDYYQESGSRQKGWTGYCLQYDREPGDPSNCILWYPVDRVKGDGIEEGAGYQGRVPLYYCAEAKPFVILEKRKKSVTLKDVVTGNCGGGCEGISSPPGYSCTVTESIGSDCDSGFFNDATVDQDKCTYKCTALASELKYSDGEFGWYVYNGDLMDEKTITKYKKKLVIPAEDGFKYYDPITKQAFDDAAGYCSVVVRVVTASGQNKYWSSRVDEGSDYSVPSLGYGFQQGFRPFGSMVPPDPVVNPWEWDAIKNQENTVKEPLLVKAFNSGDGYGSQVNAGAPYAFISLNATSTLYGICSKSRTICLVQGDSSASTNKFACPGGEACEAFPNSGSEALAASYEYIKRLFAASYGAWIYSEAEMCDKGVFADNNGNNVCDDDCPGGECNFGNSTCKSDDPDINGENCTVASCTGNMHCGKQTITINKYVCSKDKDYSCCNGGSNGAADLSYCGSSASTCFACKKGGYAELGSCSGQTPEGTSCGKAQLVAGQKKTEVYYKCTADNKNFSNDLCCPAGSTCSSPTQGICKNGTKDGESCSVDECASGSCVKSGYNTKNDFVEWSTPTSVCNQLSRPPYSGDYCAIPPVIEYSADNDSSTTTPNIRVDGSAAGITFSRNKSVHLTFNTKIDSQQLPMVMYAIKWGDEETTTVTGVEMNHRPNAGNPHSLYHTYDYWEMKKKDAGSSEITCGTDGNGNYCQASVKIKIRDNWGWCNGNTVAGTPATMACDVWQTGPTVTVRE